MKPEKTDKPVNGLIILVILISMVCLACKPSIAQESFSTPDGSMELNYATGGSVEGMGMLTLPADAVTAISPTQSTSDQLSPTIESSPTVHSVTATPTAVIPTTVPSHTPTISRWSTRTPMITPTSIPPYAQLMIQIPGPLSKIVSPLYCEYGVYTAGSGMLYIDLLDEQGNSFINKELYLYQGLSRRVYQSFELGFDLDSAAIASRLVLSTYDYYERLVSLASVDIILLQMGSDETEDNPKISLYEPYIIKNPPANNYVEGGLFVLSGMLRPVNSAPIIIDLVNEENVVIDRTSMDVNDSMLVNEYSQFSITIEYNIQTSTKVRLLMWQGSDNRIPGVIAASSIPLILYP